MSLHQAPAEDEVVDDSCGDEEINLVVAQIKRLTRMASLEYALRVGAVVIHHFYDGDTAAWRARGPKLMSYRRLARHPELPLSAGALCRCVALFELCDRLNAVSRWENLGASHFRMVLGLHGPAQEKLLALANVHRWSVRVLHQEVLQLKSSLAQTRGRRARPPAAKSLMSVKRCLDSRWDSIAQVSALTPDDQEQSLLLIDDMRGRLDALAALLRTAMSRGQAGPNALERADD